MFGSRGEDALKKEEAEGGGEGQIYRWTGDRGGFRDQHRQEKDSCFARREGVMIRWFLLSQ